MFSPVEMSFLSLASLPCLVLLAIIYWWNRRPYINQHETLNARMDLLYSVLGGTMLGVYTFRTLPQAAAIVTLPSTPVILSYETLSAFIMLGFVAMMIKDKMARVWCFNHQGMNEVEANDNVDLDPLIDRHSVTFTEYHEVVDIQSEQFGKDLHYLGAETTALRRRQRETAVVIVIMVFVCVLEGFYIVYRQNVARGGSGGVVACFYVDKLVETCIVGGMLSYGLVHAYGWRPYGLVSAVWFTSVVLSTVPVLSEMTVEYAASVVTNPALTICYATCAGVLLYMAVRFVVMNRAHTERKDMVVRLVVFIISLGISFVTGLFL